MTAILISIKPKWCELIASGEKTVEVRKTRPKLDTPFKCYIYETKDAEYEQRGIYNPKALLYKNFVHHPGKVIGEFVCDRVYDCDADSVGLFDKTNYKRLPECCMDWSEIFSYSNGVLPLYGWHISDLKIYDVPRGLGDFKTYKRSGRWVTLKKLTRPPRSWMYVEGMS